MIEKGFEAKQSTRNRVNELVVPVSEKSAERNF